MFRSAYREKTGPFPFWLLRVLSESELGEQEVGGLLGLGSAGSSVVSSLEELLEVLLHLGSGLGVVHLIFSDSGLEVDVFLHHESCGQQVVVVDELHEGNKTRLALDLLLAHGLGNLAGVLSDASNESVGEFLVLNSKQKQSIIINELNTLQQGGAHTHPHTPLQALILLSCTYVLSLVVLLDNDGLLAGVSAGSQDDNSSFLHTKETKLVKQMYCNTNESVRCHQRASLHHSITRCHEVNVTVNVARRSRHPW